MSEAIAIGTFDGVHLGHRQVIEAALGTGLPVRVLTFDPHPRVVLGNFVEAVSTLERRLELLTELGVTETTVFNFTLELAKQEPEQFAREQLANAGVVVAGAEFRFGRKRRGDLELLEQLGYEVLPVPLLGRVIFGPSIRIKPNEEKEAFLERARDALLALRDR